MSNTEKLINFPYMRLFGVVWKYPDIYPPGDLMQAEFLPTLGNPAPLLLIDFPCMCVVSTLEFVNLCGMVPVLDS